MKVLEKQSQRITVPLSTRKSRFQLQHAIAHTKQRKSRAIRATRVSRRRRIILEAKVPVPNDVKDVDSPFRALAFQKTRHSNQISDRSLRSHASPKN